MSDLRREETTGQGEAGESSSPLVPLSPGPLVSSASLPRRLGIGAACVAVGAGAMGMFHYLKNLGDSKDKSLEKNFAYDTAAMRQVDPALIKYHELGRVETGLDAPTAIAIGPDGALLVAGDHTVRRFARAGGAALDIHLAATPYCVAAAKDGAIYVGLRDHVEVYNADGSKRAAWPSLGPDAYVSAIAVDEKDAFVADSGRRIVLRCAPDGSVRSEIGKADPARGIPGLLAPSPHIEVAIGSNGLVWVSNPGRHRIEAYTRDGQLERFWGSQGTSVEAFFGCCNPADFAILPDGSFLTSEKGIARVKHYSFDGQFQGVVAAPQLFSDNVLGLDVAADADGKVMVLERGQRAVRVFVANETPPVASTAGGTP